MKRKFLCALLSAAMVATLLVGCGGNADTPAAETPAEDPAPVEAEAEPEAEPEVEPEAEPEAEATGDVTYAGDLEIMHYSTSEESEGNGGSDGFRTVLAQWDEAHPDINLTQNVLANAEYKTQIATLAAADDLPDVFLLQGMNAIVLGCLVI